MNTSWFLTYDYTEDEDLAVAHRQGDVYVLHGAYPGTIMKIYADAMVILAVLAIALNTVADVRPTHTARPIERSVVLRVGSSSSEAKALVAQMSERGLLGRGAGRLVLEPARRKRTPIYNTRLVTSQETAKSKRVSLL